MAIIIITKYQCKFSSIRSTENSYQLINNQKYIQLKSPSKLFFFKILFLVYLQQMLLAIENILTRNKTNPVMKLDIINTLTVCLRKNFIYHRNRNRKE